jgi:membrane protein YqaA with SNARE-associated domain
MKLIGLLSLFAAASSWTKWIRGLGGVGLLLLGVLDGSIVPTFGSLDLFTGILSVRQRPLWLYYAVMATIGGVIGAFTTYRLGRRAGNGWLEKKFGKRRSNRVRQLIERWGFGAVLIPTLAPPPFPASAFFFAAGSLNYPAPKYLSAVALGRAIRYGAIAYVVSHYHLHLLKFLRHPERYWRESLLVTVTIMVAIGLLFWLWGRSEAETSAGQPVAQAEESMVGRNL